jgi:putative SOS response-associated peptidase YedK
MITRYVLASSLEKIKDHFHLDSSNLYDWQPKYIVSPGDQSLIITQQEPTQLIHSTFGFTPSWARSPMQILNARAEGDKNPTNDPAFKGSKAIFLKPAFRKLLFHQRCIVIADAFIIDHGNHYFPSEAKEPPAQTNTSPASAIIPSAAKESPAFQHYLFFLKHRRHPISFAGLYDIWQDNSTGDILHSFTIITVAANSLVRKIGASRMPVILPYKLESRWLKNELGLMEILSRLEKYPSNQMDAYPVSTKIILPGPYIKEILKPTGDFLNPDKPFELIKIQSYNGHRKSKEDHGNWLGNSPL